MAGPVGSAGCCSCKGPRLRLACPAAPDYISLDGDNNHGASEGLSNEELEFSSWISMFGEKVDGGRKGVFEEILETTNTNT
ncbi:hypothetical protein Fmac_009221 [Flemingia macrophylla]|uniref:Uncharacterized protein n=1 Tax=Flemingia macrophylla TaxID=520843 RepID=A0ABD1N063_9FABA